MADDALTSNSKPDARDDRPRSRLARQPAAWLLLILAVLSAASTVLTLANP